VGPERLSGLVILGQSELFFMLGGWTAEKDFALPHRMKFKEVSTIPKSFVVVVYCLEEVVSHHCVA